MYIFNSYYASSINQVNIRAQVESMPYVNVKCTNISIIFTLCLPIIECMPFPLVSIYNHVIKILLGYFLIVDQTSSSDKLGPHRFSLPCPIPIASLRKQFALVSLQKQVTVAIALQRPFRVPVKARSNLCLIQY